MAKNYSVTITPTTRNFPVGGGGNAILTSGSGTWTAAVSEPWLTLSSTSGAVGTPVAYTVTATTNIGQRVGYVYVSGHVHTVTQDGYEAAVLPTEISAESGGKTGTITLDSPGRYSWDARPNDDWLSITPTHGVASGVLTYQVAPYNEVATRSGSFTVGDKTVTVFQYGRRMKLSTYNETRDYFTHVIPITVNALAITSWSVTPNASWISVVDGGNGQGGDLVSIAISENPSWKARTGTVTIGTETFTVTQEGRTALEFSISPSTATAAVSGGNGLLAVTATPDLPWTAKSGANWLTIVSGFASGAGNGNVVYNASPNSTLNQRTGKITVTPVTGSGLNAKTLTVTQPAAEASVSPMGYEFPASGGPVDVEVTVNSIVEWSVDESLDWISVAGSTSRQGPGTVTISASANNTVYPRNGTIRIAGKTFSVTQKGHGVEIEYESMVFGVDGGMSSVSIHPDGNMSWTAVASDTWIVIFRNASGTGDAEIEYILAPYEGDGLPRTGWIQIGDKKVYITQRAYDLDITPRADWVTGNAGAGEIGVSAGLKDIWQAIITEGSWITIVSGYDATTGSGTVRFTYTENNTGMTRTGKIMIAGEVYTLTQAARVLVNINADVVGGGTVSGAGTHTMGETATLTAIPNDGYEFLYWTGDAGETMQNPIRVTADVAKSVTAHFGPLTPEFTNVESSTEGVKLTWSMLAWAVNYKIYRAPANEVPGDALATIAAAAGCTYLDTTAEVGTTYWYWVEAIGVSDTTECKDAVSGFKRRTFPITYSNLQGATHSNPNAYAEGVAFAFVAPSVRAGYTFTGWTPSAITEDMIGAVSVTAGWSVNNYTVVFEANGGSGSMADEAMVYDAEKSLTTCAFTRKGYTFAGWAMSADGVVEYLDGATVKNLATSGTVTLYAKWTPNSYVVGFNPGQGGSGAMPDQPMTYDEEASLCANLFTRTGYTFLGWTDDENELEEVLFYDGVVVSNLTDEVDGEFDLYAVWAANSYAVRFDANGGTGTMADQAFLYDEEQAVRANMFTRTGYTFAGWIRESATGMSPPLLVDTEVVSNLTAEADGIVMLYAKWTANPYMVRFDANGGEGMMADQPFVYDAEQKMTPNSFTRKGYAFAGWALTANGAVKYGDRAAVKNLGTSGVTTLYAKWMAIPYSISYILGGGDNARTNPKTYTIEDAVVLAAPTRVGWLFDGWEPAGTIVRGTTGAVTFTAKWVELPEADAVTGVLALGPELAGLYYGVLPELTCAGRVFLGWAKDRAGTSLVSAGEVIPPGGVTLYPIWQMTELWPVDEAFSAAAANVYDGILWNGDGLVGLVQVKTAKQSVKKTTDKKTKVVTVTTNITATATVTDANGKKWSYSKGVVSVGGVVTGLKCTAKGCPVAEFGATLGKNGLEGEWGEYEIFGARKVKPEAVYRGNRTLSFENGDWMQLKVDPAGAVKIAGGGGGKSFSASARLIVGDGFAYVPVYSGSNRVLVHIADDGEVSVVSSSSGAMSVGDVTASPRFDGWEESANEMVGVAYFARPVMDGISWPLTFKASALPTGCKINSKTGVISGIPTKVGTFLTKVTATSKSNKKWTASCVVTNRIVMLPEWARGQFAGNVDENVHTMTVGASGKVSGKFKDGITNWTFSASSFATNSVTVGETNLFCCATAKGTYKVKSGKKTVSKSVTAPISFTLVAVPDVSPIAAEGLGDFADGSDNVEIRRVEGVRISVGEAGGGTVKMDKSYGQVASNKIVKLTAKVKKGWAFAGWYDVGTDDEDALVTQALTYALVSDGTTDRFLEARFVPESALSADDIALDWNAPTEIYVGVSYMAQPKVAGTAAVKIASVSGIPKGLVWKSGKVSGVPTVAKTNAVSVKVALTTNSKKTWTFKVPIEVKPLPEWAVGTLEGEVESDTLFSVTVGKTGKVSGKLRDTGGTWAFSAASFASYVPAEGLDGHDAFMVTVKAKNGKKASRTFEIKVAEEVVEVLED